MYNLLKNIFDTRIINTMKLSAFLTLHNYLINKKLDLLKAILNTKNALNIFILHIEHDFNEMEDHYAFLIEFKGNIYYVDKNKLYKTDLISDDHLIQKVLNSRRAIILEDIDEIISHIEALNLIHNTQSV